MNREYHIQAGDFYFRANRIECEIIDYDSVYNNHDNTLTGTKILWFRMGDDIVSHIKLANVKMIKTYSVGNIIFYKLEVK